MFFKCNLSYLQNKKSASQFANALKKQLFNLFVLCYNTLNTHIHELKGVSFIMDLYSVNLVSTVLRLIMAAIFGGVIGFEREASKKPAGLRTHMLICIGSALVMLTGQYVYQSITPAADPTRIGAQVISGIGFLGVGTIIIIGRQRVKGLTTAAGLWASACMGLAIGIGFYSGAIVSVLLIFVVETILRSFADYILKYAKHFDLYIEVEDKSNISELQNLLVSKGVCIENLVISRDKTISPGSIGLTLEIKQDLKRKHFELITELMSVDWIKYVQEE